MYIGLIMLAVVAVLIFFGVSERFFRRIGISNWLAFALVLALVVGAVLPSIKIGTAFSLNVGGFLVPIVGVVLFGVVMGLSSELTRGLIASVAVAGVAVAVRMLMMPTEVGSVVTASIIVGFVGGAVAYLIGMTRLATLFSAVLGIVMGDIVVNFIGRFVLASPAFTLGDRGVFDSIIVAAIVGVIFVEAISAIKRTMNRKQIRRNALNMEAGRDERVNSNEVSTVVYEEEFGKYFDEDDK